MTLKSRKTAKKLQAKKKPEPKKAPPGKPFMIGYDPRRNLKGVPKGAIKAREMIRRIASELMRIKEQAADGSVIEYDITRIEAMIRLMFSSKAPQDKQILLKSLYPGLVVDEVELNKNEPILLRVVYNDKRVQNPSANSAPEAGAVPPVDGEEEDSPGGT